jgi:hypothetical protein
METLGLSVQDLARMFHVSARSAKSWTTGGTRVPTWLMPALQLYGLLPPVARNVALESLVRDGVTAGAGRTAAPTQPPANVYRHPFARIEEL